MAVHDHGWQVDAPRLGGHADVAEFVVEELSDDGALSNPLSPKHGNLESCHHAFRPWPPCATWQLAPWHSPLCWHCQEGPWPAYSSDCSVSPIQEAFLLQPSPSLQDQERSSEKRHLLKKQTNKKHPLTATHQTTPHPSCLPEIHALSCPHSI